MSATLINPTLYQVSGTITAAEVNALGTAPFQFITPLGFVPLSFVLTVIDGAVQPIFTDRLIIFSLNNGRPYLGTADPQGLGSINIAGITAASSGPPNFFALNESVNVMPNIENNVALAPADFADPTPGDLVYKYNLVGYVLQ